MFARRSLPVSLAFALASAGMWTARPAAGQKPAAGHHQPVETSWQRTAAWTSIGIALALATTGVVLGLSAASREEDIDNLIDFRDTEGDPLRFTGATRDRYDDLVAEGDRLETLSIVALGATGAAAAAAVAFFLWDARRGPSPGQPAEPGAPAPPPTGLGAAVVPGGGGLHFRGSF